MLAKSAELANERHGLASGASGFQGGALLLAVLAVVYHVSRRQASRGYRNVSNPLHAGHESD